MRMINWKMSEMGMMMCEMCCMCIMSGMTHREFFSCVQMRIFSGADR